MTAPILRWALKKHLCGDIVNVVWQFAHEHKSEAIFQCNTCNKSWFYPTKPNLHERCCGICGAITISGKGGIDDSWSWRTPLDGDGVCQAWCGVCGKCVWVTGLQRDFNSRVRWEASAKLRTFTYAPFCVASNNTKLQINSTAESLQVTRGECPEMTERS